MAARSVHSNCRHGFLWLEEMMQFSVSRTVFGRYTSLRVNIKS